LAIRPLRRHKPLESTGSDETPDHLLAHLGA